MWSTNIKDAHFMLTCWITRNFSTRHMRRPPEEHTRPSSRYLHFEIKKWILHSRTYDIERSHLYCFYVVSSSAAPEIGMRRKFSQFSVIFIGRQFCDRACSRYWIPILGNWFTRRTSIDHIIICKNTKFLWSRSYLSYEWICEDSVLVVGIRCWLSINCIHSVQKHQIVRFLVNEVHELSICRGALGMVFGEAKDPSHS